MRAKSVLTIVCATSLTGCHSIQEKNLREHIQIIEGRLQTVERSITQKTSNISGSQVGIDARASLRPLVAWTSNYNARPPAEKLITFRQTGRQGQIAGWSKNCKIAGKRAWYVEFDSSTATKADLLIDGLRLYYQPGQVTLRAGLDLDAETEIHWHIDPSCIGGGFGDSEGFEADARGPIFFRLSLLPMQTEKLPYRIEAVSPTSIEGRVSVDLGVFGKHSFPFRWNAVAETLSDGSVSLLVDEEGEIGPLPNGQTYTYRVKTVNPQATIADASLQLRSDLEFEIDPTVVQALRAATMAQ